MRRNPLSYCEQAFARLELLVAVVIVALLAVVALPALANTRNRSQRLLCIANLRQAGHAYHVWGTDHGNKTPCRTGLSEEGAFGSLNGIRNSAWWQWAWLSNELVTPKILVCPSDVGVGTARVIARNWGSINPSGGYASIGFRDRATSYTVALDAFFDQPRSLLSWNRNVQPAGSNSSCSSTVGFAWFFNLGIYPPGVFWGGWTNAIHGLEGNALFYDGSVEQLSNLGFINALRAPHMDDNGVAHFLSPL